MPGGWRAGAYPEKVIEEEWEEEKKKMVNAGEEKRRKKLGRKMWITDRDLKSTRFKISNTNEYC